MNQNEELSQKLAYAVERMPAFPASVQKVLALTRNADCPPRELIRVIERDPVVTLKVLRIVNSAYYGLATPITTIDHAVVFIGFNTIKNLALGIAAMGMLPRSNLAGLDGAQYLRHSLLTALIAKRLAARCKSADPMDCFIAGLLHDFGKVVLAQFLPDEFRKAVEISLWRESSLHLALREVIGVDHAAVAAMLVEKWKFPEQIVQAIRYQHGPEIPASEFIACVFAANQICKHLGQGFGGNPFVEAFPAYVAAQLGGGLQEVMDSIDDMPALQHEARLFSQI